MIRRDWVPVPVDGWWPWPPPELTWGEIGALYRAAGAPWEPDATTASHPTSLGWRFHRPPTGSIVERFYGRLEKLEPEGVYLFLGRSRVGTGDFGIPILEAEWVRVPTKYRYVVLPSDASDGMTIYRFDDGPSGSMGPCCSITGDLTEDWSHLACPPTPGPVLDSEGP